MSMEAKCDMREGAKSDMREGAERGESGSKRVICEREQSKMRVGEKKRVICEREQRAR